METVKRWDMAQIDLTGTAEGNPYTDVELWAEFRHETDYVRIDGFYDGDRLYAIRFMPTSLGEWIYEVHSGDPAMDGKTGGFLCVEPEESNHGPVSVHDTYHLRHADGTRHFSVGTTCYAWIYQSDELIEKTFAALAEYGFNKMRMCVFPKYYVYNKKEPAFFPFIRNADGSFDFTRFDPRFFSHLDGILLRLRDTGIESDLILFHPYDKWGFMSMGRENDDRYLRYMVARYAAYRNVWWSMANEFDLFTVNRANRETPEMCGPAEGKETEDWDRFFRIVQSNDPYQHLRSIHNCRDFYDHGKPWVTHCSVQRNDPIRTAECTTEWRAQYKKPIVYDECAYEGNIMHGWGNISGQEMMRRFWECVLRGGHMGHGETYLGHDDILWWSHGGDLHGESPARIRFLKEILNETPENLSIDPKQARLGVTEGCAGEGYRILYFGLSRPSYWAFMEEEGVRWTVEVIDTWDMTVTPLPDMYEGSFRIDLPGKEYMAVRLKKAEE